MREAQALGRDAPGPRLPLQGVLAQARAEEGGGVRGKQTALMPGNEDRVGYWLTPEPLMRALQEEFDFDWDATPFPRPEGWDSLREEWPGKRIYVNPPFNLGMSMRKWALKSIEESQKGKLVVFIGPVDRWVELLIREGAEARAMGTVYWESPDRRKITGGSRPQALFILRPKVIA